ncbi:MAG: helix-turn-helix domain-containing protein [Victivallaceae bacterium]|nr:helix-turn-helix domain-containing protein [Victivallaceae bacterium]
MENKHEDLPLNFGTPLTARDESPDDDIPCMDELEAERKKIAEEAEEAARAAARVAAAVGVQQPSAAPDAAKDDENNTPADAEDGEAEKPALKSAARPPIPVEVLLPNHDRAPFVMPENEPSSGNYLRRIREESRLTLRQVSETTCIGIHYLEALEADNMKKMPPPVYVIAYIRKLCGFYNISPDSAERMIGNLRDQLRTDLPDSIINQVELDTEAVEQEEKEVKKLCWIIGGGIAGFIILAVAVSLLIWRGGGETRPAATPAAITAKALTPLLPAPPSAVPVLPEPAR